MSGVDLSLLQNNNAPRERTHCRERGKTRWKREVEEEKKKNKHAVERKERGSKKKKKGKYYEIKQGGTVDT